MARVLMVAEKPSVARSITEALAGKVYGKRKGLSQTCPVFEFRSKFLEQDASIHVTSVRGHLYHLGFSRECKSWELDGSARYDAETIVIPIKHKGYDQEEDELIKHLQFEAKYCTHLVLWLDCDMEGENICFEVISVVKKETSLSDENIYRAHFSSLTQVDIKKALGTLGRPNINASKAVEARREIDLKVGVSFTTFQVDYINDNYKVMSMLSFGPCQTPTLGFCVERSDEIASFEPEPYYLLSLKLDTKPPLTVQVRFKSEAEVNAIKEKFEQHKALGVKVINVKNSIEETLRPAGLNTIRMLQLASTHLQLNPYTVMQIAEQLYLSGCITYPRTRTTQYADSFPIRDTIGLFTKHPEWGRYCQSLLEDSIKLTKGTDVGDHPPITPCKYNPRFPSPRAKSLYELIVQHFLATVSHDVKYLTRAVTFLIASEELTVTGTTTMDAGFSALKLWMLTRRKDVDLSHLNMGDVIQIGSIEVSAEKTSPPQHLTESELLALMEANHIGTAGSIPTHIQHLSDRNYVLIDTKSRSLIPTKLGTMLVHEYQKIDPELVSPVIRGNMEKNIDRIAIGKSTYEIELRRALAIYKEKFEFFCQRIYSTDFFEGAFPDVPKPRGKDLKWLKSRQAYRNGDWTCFSCGANGHFSRDCPSGRGRSRGSRGVERGVYRGGRSGCDRRRIATGSCFICNQSGHFARDCPCEGDESEKLID